MPGDADSIAWALIARSVGARADRRFITRVSDTRLIYMQESIYSEFGGSVVANRPWAFLQHRVVSAQVEAARRQAQTASERATAQRRAGYQVDR